MLNWAMLQDAKNKGGRLTFPRNAYYNYTWPLKPVEWWCTTAYYWRYPGLVPCQGNSSRFPTVLTAFSLEHGVHSSHRNQQSSINCRWLQLHHPVTLCRSSTIHQNASLLAHYHSLQFLALIHLWLALWSHWNEESHPYWWFSHSFVVGVSDTNSHAFSHMHALSLIVV